MVITRDGCPSGIYAEIAILDKSGVQIDFTNDTTTRVLPKTKVKLTFDTFNEQAEKAQIGEIRCSWVTKIWSLGKPLFQVGSFLKELLSTG